MARLLASNIRETLATHNLLTLELQLTSDIVEELKKRLPSEQHDILKGYYREVYDEWSSALNGCEVNRMMTSGEQGL